MKDEKGLYNWNIMYKRGSGRRQIQIGVNGIHCGRANTCVYGQYEFILSYYMGNDLFNCEWIKVSGINDK